MSFEHATQEAGAMQLGDRHIPYRVKRSARRKTVTLTIDPDNGLVLYCPRRFSTARLHAVMKEKSRWILNKTREMEALQARRVIRKWEPGALLPFQGADYPLVRHINGRMFDIRVDQGELKLFIPEREWPNMAPEQIREQAISGYRIAAERELLPRLEFYQHVLGLHPEKVRIRDQKKRWGSCSARGSINLNWRLILAPPAISDYVIVHELCHLKELNHSGRFWNLVAGAVPDHKSRRAWLREHGSLLFL